MTSTATLQRARDAAFDNRSPRRLGQVVKYGAALGVAGTAAPEAIDAIEDAIWAEGALPADRASRKRAWMLARERALRAFYASHNPDDETVDYPLLGYTRGDHACREAREAADTAYMRAYHAAPGLLERLPNEAVVADLAAAIQTAEPLVSAAKALKLANGTIKSLSQPPTDPRGPDRKKRFDTIVPQPADRATHLHQKASKMVSLTLKMTAPSPAPETTTAPEPTWRPLDISRPAAWKDPANMPEALRGLAYVDFDPSFDSPPPAWLAKGLLPRAGIGLLIGESGAGKSFAAIHSALAVAWGIPLFGSKVKRGAVLYIAAEGGKSVLRRFKAANAEMGGAIAAANLTRVPGASALRRAPLRIVHEAPDLSREGDCAPLVRTIENAAAEFEAGGDRLALVIIDTWHAAMGGGDENSAADAGHALKPLIAASERGDFLTLIVHHPGKDTDRGARGSNALPAAADAVIAITVPGFEGAKAKPSTAMRKATVTKMRDGEAGGGFNYRLGIVPIGKDEDGDVVTTCIVEPCDAPKEDAEGLSDTDREFMAAVSTAVAEANGKQVTVREVRLRFYAGRQDAKEGAKRMAFNRAVNKALAAGRLGTDEHSEFLWLADPSAQESAH